MNWEQKFKKLADRARIESPPLVDVTGSVLYTLAAGTAQPVTVSERLWMWLAAASAAVALPCAVITLIIYSAPTEPLTEIAQVISWVIQ